LKGSERSPREPTGLEAVRRRMEEKVGPPIAQLIGFELTKVARGKARVELDAGPRHANPMGTLHGGVICDIADAAIGVAYLSTLGPGESFTTMEVKVNFLRPVWNSHLIADASVLKKGRTTGLMVCKVVQDEGKLVAYATGTCMTVAGEDGSGLSRVRKEAGSSRRSKS
jgi:uncharacterized protein (TIGR00369 family)